MLTPPTVRAQPKGWASRNFRPSRTQIGKGTPVSQPIGNNCCGNCNRWYNRVQQGEMEMIGEQIKRVRNERNLSLRSLSSLIKNRGFVDGLSYAAVQRIESGDRKVATHELAELADVLGTSIATLIGSRDRSASLSLAARVSEHPSDGTLSAVKARAVEVLEAQDLLGRLIEPLRTRQRPE